jgi:hypothetical protein
MTKDELTGWALSTGWKLIEGHPSLCKPARPKEAIVRLVLKATVANVEIRKPSGKWEKVSGAPYSDVIADDEGGLPTGLGLEKLSTLSRLIQDNRDAMVFGG